MPSYSDPAIPASKLSRSPPGPRNMKLTLFIRYLLIIASPLPCGTKLSLPHPANAFSVPSTMQLSCATSPRRNPTKSWVYPSPIDPSEALLLRRNCRTVSQLPSRSSIFIGTYHATIGRHDDSISPDCRAAEHTTAHLFTCPATPLYLSPIDLRVNPLEAADFLTRLPAIGLPPLPRPLPEPVNCWIAASSLLGRGVVEVT